MRTSAQNSTERHRIPCDAYMLLMRTSAQNGTEWHRTGQNGTEWHRTCVCVRACVCVCVRVQTQGSTVEAAVSINIYRTHHISALWIASVSPYFVCVHRLREAQWKQRPHPPRSSSLTAPVAVFLCTQLLSISQVRKKMEGLRPPKFLPQSFFCQFLR